MEIVLASTNLHKIRELREMLKHLTHLELLSLHSFPQMNDVEETGSSFQENAILKAEITAKQLNKWVLADDSGLVVPALNGEPGIYSRRYAGLTATDAENRQKLLNSMQGLSEFERSAYYECCLALASPEGLKKCVTGICEGYILTKERGRHGFGYDALFIKYDYEKTFAELDETTKNRVSHRRKAFERLVNFLEALKN